MAARHSSLVDYNAGGLMLKLLGRYVAYIALIEIIIYGMHIKYQNVDKQKYSFRKSIVTFVLVACTVICYLILYKRILWNPADGWLDSLRGLDNIAFLKLGSIFLALVCIEIGLLQIYGKKILIVCWILFASINICCSVDASRFYSENHDYIQSTRKLIKEYGAQKVSVYSTDVEKYIGALQNYSFLYHNQLEGEIWFLQAGFTEEPINMSTDRIVFFTIDKKNVDMEKYNEVPYAVIGNPKSKIFYFRFDESLFEEKKNFDGIKIVKTDKEIIVTCGESETDIILVMNGEIMPCKYQDGAYIYKIDGELWDSVSEVVMYNFNDLTSMSIEL